MRVFLALLIIITASSASAQTASTSPVVTITPTSTPSSVVPPSPDSSPLPSVSPSVTSTAVASPTPESERFVFYSRSIVLTKFRRFFTRNPLKRGELTDAIANALQEKLQQQAAEGNVIGASRTLTQLEQETDYLQTIITTLNANTDNEVIHTFLANISTDSALRFSELESTNLPAGEGLATKMIDVQAKTLRKIVKILEKDMPDERRDEKLAKIMAKYSEKEAKLDTKFAKRLALVEELEEETNEQKLEDELNQKEDETVESAVALPTTDLNALTVQLQSKKQERALIVLEKLLLKAPDAAKAGIETAINAVLKVQLDIFEKDPGALQSFLDDHSGSSSVREKVLERLKEKASEPLKQQIETKQKLEEANRGSAQKKNEQSQEVLKKQKEQELQSKSKSSASPETKGTATPKASFNPTTSSTPKSTSSPAASLSEEKSEIEVKIKDGVFEKTSYTVKKGSRLTVKYKNEDTTSRALKLSNGGGSSSFSKSETTLASFVINEAVTFTATGVAETGLIAVTQ